MSMKAFCPRSRKVFVNVVLEDTAGGVIRVAPRKGIPRGEMVLLPHVGFSDAQGVPVYLGDAFKREVDGRVETFIVGPLPAKGEVVTAFHLRLIRVEKSASAAASSGEVAGEDLQGLTPADAVAKLERVGNVFENFAQFVPQNEHYCYNKLSWNPETEVFDIGYICPFWQRSDHGMVYCRLLAKGSLIDDSEREYQKAILHFGSEAAVDDANEIWLVWDQVKGCGVNTEASPEDDDEDELLHDEF